MFENYFLKALLMALLHFHTPLLLLMTHQNAAESFTVALTLTLVGYESVIAPF